MTYGGWKCRRGPKEGWPAEGILPVSDCVFPRWTGGCRRWYQSLARWEVEKTVTEPAGRSLSSGTRPLRGRMLLGAHLQTHNNCVNFVYTKVAILQTGLQPACTPIIITFLEQLKWSKNSTKLQNSGPKFSPKLSFPITVVDCVARQWFKEKVI